MTPANNPTDTHLLIAGAGIGGLTAALCLAQAGHQVTVFERADALREAGAGIQCGANAVTVLRSLGLGTPLEAMSVLPEAIEFRDFQAGSLLYRSELGQGYQQKYGQPYLHLHRADLVDLLAQKLSGFASVTLRLSSEVYRVEERADSVQLALASGEVVEGDCLIAADGIRSALRSQFTRPAEPRFTGNVAWRGVVPVSHLEPGFMPPLVTNFVGPDKHFVMYYVRRQQLLNFVGVVENTDWQEESWTSKAPWSELQADFAGWHPMVQQVLAAVDPDHCYRWALFDHLPFQPWSSARCTLLGDAAHATLPFVASGAALAIEDARILQRCFDQAETVSDALMLYQRNRINRTAQIQRLSRRFGKLYHVQNPLLRKLAFQALALGARRGERLLPEYDANQVDLA